VKKGVAGRLEQCGTVAEGLVTQNNRINKRTKHMTEPISLQSKPRRVAKRVLPQTRPTSLFGIHLSLALILAFLAIRTVGAAAEVPFFLEDFEDGNADDHSPVKWNAYRGAGTPVVVDGSLVMNTSGTRGQGCYSSTYNAVGDVSIRTQMRALKGNAATGMLTVWSHTAADGVSYHGSVRSNYIEIGDNAELKMSAVIPIDIFASDVSVQFDVVGRTLSLTVWKTGEEKPSAPQLTGTSKHDYPPSLLGIEASPGITQFAVRSYDAIRIGDSLNQIPTGPVVPFLDDFSDGDPTDGEPVAWSKFHEPAKATSEVSAGHLIVSRAPDDATLLRNSRSSQGPISIRSEFSLKPPGATAVSRVERVGIWAHQSETGMYVAGIYPDGAFSGEQTARLFLDSTFQYGQQYRVSLDLSKPVVLQLDIQEVVNGNGSYTVSASVWQAGQPMPAKPQIIQNEATLFRKGGRSGISINYSQGPIAYNYFSVARDPESHFKPFLLHDFIERKSLKLTVPAGTVLQSSPAVFPPQWSDVNGSGSVEMPTTGPAGFFRLRSE
jgi:hypothetical protein